MCVVFPALWVLTIGYVISLVAVEDQAFATSLALALLGLALVSIPAVTYWFYRRSPRRIAAKSEMKSLQQSKFPEQYQSVQRLFTEYPHTFGEPKLMYDLEPEVSAFTFGAGQNLNIQLSTGLLLTDEQETFNAIVTHEMGHLENKDVGKTGFAISAMSVLKVVLPAILVAWVLNDAYYKMGMLLSGTAAGYDLSYIVSEMQLGRTLLFVGAFALIFIVVGGIVFIMRNQFVRLREFYADARALDWAKSPAGLESTLQKHETLSSRFETLRRFHPSNEERIRVLKDNVRFFIPNLWIIFTAGLLYGYIATETSGIGSMLLVSQGIFVATPSYILFNALLAVILFGVLVFAISSEFHRFIMRETLTKARYFSRAALLNIVKAAIVFSLGINLGLVIPNVEAIEGYFDDLGGWATGVLNIFSTAWLLQATRFLIALLFIWFLGSMLLRRSFSRTSARRNFLLATLLTAILYPLTNPTIAHLIFTSDVLWVATILAFLGVTFVFVKLRDASLHCPQCHLKIRLSPDFSLSCPHCKNQLYSWAFSSV